MEFEKPIGIPASKILVPVKHFLLCSNCHVELSPRADLTKQAKPGILIPGETVKYTEFFYECPNCHAIISSPEEGPQVMYYDPATLAQDPQYQKMLIQQRKNTKAHNYEKRPKRRTR